MSADGPIYLVLWERETRDGWPTFEFQTANSGSGQEPVGYYTDQEKAERAAKALGVKVVEIKKETKFFAL